MTYQHHPYMVLYFVSFQERLWRHWARQRIYATTRILYVSIQGFLFERVRKHTCYVRDNKHLPLEYVLTSLLFSRRDKVYIETVRKSFFWGHNFHINVLAPLIFHIFPLIQFCLKQKEEQKEEQKENKQTLNQHITTTTNFQNLQARLGLNMFSVKNLVHSKWWDIHVLDLSKDVMTWIKLGDPSILLLKDLCLANSMQK